MKFKFAEQVVNEIYAEPIITNENSFSCEDFEIFLTHNLCEYCIFTDYGDYEPIYDCECKYCDEAYDVMIDMENDKT